MSFSLFLESIFEFSTTENIYVNIIMMFPWPKPGQIYMFLELMCQQKKASVFRYPFTIYTFFPSKQPSPPFPVDPPPANTNWSNMQRAKITGVAPVPSSIPRCLQNVYFWPFPLLIFTPSGHDNQALSIHPQGIKLILFYQCWCLGCLEVLVEFLLCIWGQSPHRLWWTYCVHHAELQVIKTQQSITPKHPKYSQLLSISIETKSGA